MRYAPVESIRNSFETSHIYRTAALQMKLLITLNIHYTTADLIVASGLSCLASDRCPDANS